MKSEDIKICREVQRNAQMAMKAIETISDKVYNEELARHISKQTIKYSELKNRAMEKLLEAKALPYHTNRMADLMLVGGIHSKTMLNTSTSHIAQLMIQGSNRGVTEMCKVLNHNEDAGVSAIELAKELMDFEEKNIEKLKTYL
ncbi:MAG: hypothetical protein IJ282_00680 [Lachnospiraceae bacterium]|nr:hypothetical protein [Lachnospiraceae bacterium]